jgi:hypothetical protein
MRQKRSLKSSSRTFQARITRKHCADVGPRPPILAVSRTNGIFADVVARRFEGISPALAIPQDMVVRAILEAERGE